MNRELCVTSIEKELKFIESCRNHDIEMCVIDLDDTVCESKKIFVGQMVKSYNFLAANCKELSREEWKSEIETLNNELYKVDGVSLKRWDHVVDHLEEKYSLNKNISDKRKQIFQEIYWIAPKIIEGAYEGLEFLKKVGMKFGIHTHAEEEWTKRKYDWLGLEKYLPWEDIKITDQNKHKNKEAWEETFKYFNVKPENCVVIGDSPKSDINPAYEAGVRHCLMIESDNLLVTQDTQLITKPTMIKNLSQISDAVIALP